MKTLLGILGLSCALCLVLTPLARRLARRWGLVDRPDGRRKMHAQAIPVAGGLAVLLAGTGALAAGFLVVLLREGSASSPLRESLIASSPTLLGLLLAAVLLCLVGVIDDFGHLRGRHKLFGQVVAVGIVMQSGLVVRHVHLFEGKFELGLLAVPLTALWLLGAINSLNLIDGMDGLSTSVGLIVSLALAVLAVAGGQWAAACVAVALAGALLGFLRYNFPPATVFLGDAGSMLIGLVVGALAIQGSLKGPATVALAAPTALLTIPFLDTAAAIVRRKLTGRSIYTTDRGHLHHCLLRRGLSSRSVLGWVAGFCLLTVVGALVTLILQNELFAVLAAAAVVAILVTSHLFGYVEYLLLKKHFLAIARSVLGFRAGGAARNIEIRLQGSADWQDLWNNLTATAHQLNLVRIRLNVNAPAFHEGYHAQWDRPQDADELGLWRADLPLDAGGQVLGRLEVSGYRDHEPVCGKIATLALVVEAFEQAARGLIGEANQRTLDPHPPYSPPAWETSAAIGRTPTPVSEA